jgi:hypothetical protein
LIVFSGVVRGGPDNPSLRVYPRRGLAVLLVILGVALVVPFGS